MDTLFGIEHSAIFGDHIVAKKDFSEGELICCEGALLNVPKEAEEGSQEYDFCCISCFQILRRKKSLKCPQCQWPVCSRACSQTLFHSSLECSLFSDKRILPARDIYPHLMFLRLFLSKKRLPDQFEKFSQLSSNLGSSQKMFKNFCDNESKQSLKFLKDVCGLSEVTLNEVSRVWATLKINYFLISSEDEEGHQYRGYSVFENCCKLSHSCSPNVEWSLESTLAENGAKQWKMNLHARQRIEKGEMLTIAYSDDGMDFGTHLRRGTYLRGFPFACFCSRCTDSSEGGTFFSSPRCPKCRRGLCLPEDPLDSNNCLWKCNKCFVVQQASSLQEKLSKIERDLRYLTGALPPTAAFDLLDKFLEQTSREQLHPSHFLIFQGTVHWLLHGDFTEFLMRQTRASTKLFEKIMQRSACCLSLTKKFMTTQCFVQLELFVCDTIASYAFRSADCETINAPNYNPRLKLRFCKLLCHHLLSASKWMETQPKHKSLEDRKSMLANLVPYWQRQSQKYARDLDSFQQKLEDVTLLQFQRMFN